MLRNAGAFDICLAVRIISGRLVCNAAIVTVRG